MDSRVWGYSDRPDCLLYLGDRWRSKEPDGLGADRGAIHHRMESYEARGDDSEYPMNIEYA